MRFSALIRLSTFTIALCTWSTLIHAEGSKPDPKFDFVISPQGNDSWSGQLAEANTAHTDGPFATLEKAKSEVRTAAVEKPKG